MSDDLISRKDLIGTERLLMTDIVENNEVARYILEQVLHDIEHAPAAFDKEKVMVELHNAADLNIGDGLWHVELQDALEIVDRGGV